MPFNLRGDDVDNFEKIEKYEEIKQLPFDLPEENLSRDLFNLQLSPNKQINSKKVTLTK